MKVKNFIYLPFCLFIGTSVAGALPEIPEPFKYGVGGIDNGKIYIGLGSLGNNWYMIDTNQSEKKWTKIAQWPTVPREQATATIIDGKIYVFGGIGKDKSGVITLQKDVYSYDIAKDKWEKLMTRPPVSLAGHVSFIHNGHAVSTGGVNENIFNGYFSDVELSKGNSALTGKVNRDYFSKPADDYFLNNHIISYDPSKNQWKNLGTTPFPGTAGSSVIFAEQQIYILGGERKPGLRSVRSWTGELSHDRIKWSELPPVASPEGVSGAYASVIDGNIFLAGGAYFPGAAEKYSNGEYWSHKGLDKAYSKEIYQLIKNDWKKVGSLPEGLAYGVSLPWQGGMLILGGEKKDGKAVSDVIYLKKNDKQIKIVK